jgi:hypothetical protein
MSAWETVFDTQMEIWQWWQSPQGISYANGFVGDMNRKGKGYESMADEFADIEIRRLYRAEPIYVAPEMQDLLDAALPGFEPEELLPSDLVTNHGFVVFPRPFHVLDVSDKKIAWRAMCWSVTDFTWKEGEQSRTEPGIFVTMYSHMDDPDDIGYHPLVYDYAKTKWSLVHMAPWSFGMEIPDDFKAKQSLRQIQCFFRLTMQHITTHEPQPTSRATRRRAKRARMPEKNVTVIRLRRPKTQREGEPVPANYSHRFLVRGFWRNQWFPSLKTHRQIYIHDYIKGPADKPLRISERRAFELVQ